MENIRYVVSKKTIDGQIYLKSILSSTMIIWTTDMQDAMKFRFIDTAQSLVKAVNEAEPETKPEILEVSVSVKKVS
jgi:hypothetical protein